MSQLQIRLLGSFEVTLDGQPVGHLGYDKVRALLAYLAVEQGRPHRREVLATLLWPEQPPDVARHSLRQALSVLRRAIGKGYLCADRDAIGLLPDPMSSVDARLPVDAELPVDAGLSVDAEVVGRHLARVQAHPHADVESCPDCIDELQAAAELYGGDFLEGLLLGDCAEFETWAVTLREQLRLQILDALYTLTRYHLHRGRYAQARDYAQRQIEIEPYREEAHRQLMRCLVRAGQRSAALAQYDKCRRVLADELGVEPTYETRALYERIRAAGEARSHNLPPQLTALIGREGDLERMAECLANPNCRLLTLTGPGGIGKTRLALRAAAEQAGAYLHGAWFVPLAGVDSPARIAPALVDALGLLPSGYGDLAAEVVEYLAGRDLLLVLDNFEHLLEGATFLVEILKGAPEVQIVVTSRERLGLRAEWVLPVRGLPAPAEGRGEAIDCFAAVRLFVERARQVRGDFELAPADTAAIARICRLVGGVPLAIELAASSVAASSCEQIAADIEGGLDALTTTMRDVPARHRSMRAVLDHSWDMLSPEERPVLANLAAFSGGFSPAAAKAVAGATVPILAALVNKSLLRHDAAGRYQLHPLPRQYAAGRLAAGPQERQVRACQAEYYLAFLQEQEPHLKGGQQRSALRQIGSEIENVRAAWRWAAAERRLDLLAAPLEALYLFYWARNWFAEGQEMLALAEGAIQGAGGQNDVLRARLWARAAEYDGWLGDYDRARERLRKSIEILEGAGERRELAAAIELLGRLDYWQGNYEPARVLFEESLALCRRIGDRAGQAQALNCLSNVACEADADYALGDVLLEESLALAREIGDQFAIAKVLLNQGASAHVTGDLARARQLYEESLGVYREIDYPHGLGAALRSLAQVTSATGDRAAALALLEENLALNRRTGNRQATIYTLQRLGEIAGETGAHDRARAYLDEALNIALNIDALPLALGVLLSVANLFARLGQRRSAVELMTFVAGQPAAGQELTAQADESLVACAAELAPGDARAWRQRGRSMSMAAAVALARQELPPL